MSDPSSKTLLDQLREELEKRAFHPGEWNEVKHIMYCDFCHYSREYIERAGHAAGCILKPIDEPTSALTFQGQVTQWMHACFGEEIARDRVERNHRFLEEALELVQANGCGASEAHQLVDYVFNRPAGELVQEVGGVMVTLAALCSASDALMDLAAKNELARVWTKIDVIRAKQAAKPKHSPLPGPSEPPNCTHPFARLGIDADGVMWCTECFAKPLVIPPPFGEGSVTKDACPPPKVEGKLLDVQVDVIGVINADDPRDPLHRRW